MVRGALAVMIVGLMAAPAGAATLEVRSRDHWWSPYQAEPVSLQDLVFDGEGTEANDVTVAPSPESYGVVFTDPGHRIRTQIGIPSADPLGPRVWAGYVCRSTVTSVAVCTVTPGDECWSGGCSGPNLPQYDGLIKVAGNAGDDRIRILPSSFNSVVWGVDGDDTILVRNGKTDNVSCGPGFDTATVDAGDILQPDCEVVARG